MGIWVEEEADERGRYGASLIFVRWDGGGERPVGHAESGDLVWGKSPAEAEERIKALSLYDVKAALDAAIAARPEDW